MAQITLEMIYFVLGCYHTGLIICVRGLIWTFCLFYVIWWPSLTWFTYSYKRAMCFSFSSLSVLSSLFPSSPFIISCYHYSILTLCLSCSCILISPSFFQMFSLLFFLSPISIQRLRKMSICQSNQVTLPVWGNSLLQTLSIKVKIVDGELMKRW